MRQRVTVARALLADPPVLFLDEPTRAVDPVHAQELRTLIRRDLVQRANKTVILATNLLDEAWEICDRVAVVNHGRIVACGPPRQLGGLEPVLRYRADVDRVDEGMLARARAVAGVRTLSCSPDGDGVSMHFELDTSERALSNLLRTLSLDGVLVRSFRPIEPRPFEIFQAVTDGTSNGV
jgi:ABC-2 type transport system ATP-binding protein